MERKKMGGGGVSSSSKSAWKVSSEPESGKGGLFNTHWLIFCFMLDVH